MHKDTVFVSVKNQNYDFKIRKSQKKTASNYGSGFHIVVEIFNYSARKI